MRRSALLIAILASCAGPKPAPEADPATGATLAPAPKAKTAAATEPSAPAPQGPPPAVEPPAPPAEEPPPATEPKLKRRSKYDPPATLGHLDTTPPEQRKEIDDLIVVMFDVEAGRDSHDAKAKLATIGKPAFLPILGKMAMIRDTMTDNDSMNERLVESSLKLADECLRDMDGYLDAHDKAPIRPGTEKDYVEYILWIHYRRWLDGMGSPPLKDMQFMPGPFDPEKFTPDED